MLRRRPCRVKSSESEFCGRLIGDLWVGCVGAYLWAFSDDDIFAPMAVDAMQAVRTINIRGDVKYPVKAVNVLKAHGKSARESMFVPGYALNCVVASQGA